MTFFRRLSIPLLIGLFAIGLGLRPTAASRAQVSAFAPTGLHLTLGNPSNAVADPQFPANYLIERTQYALAYQRDLGIPAWVSWHLEAQDLGSTPRGNFAADTSLPAGWYQVQTGDYSGSGYDRGHMTPSGDRTSTRANNDATFLMTNIIPQAPDNNQGPWANLENDCRAMLPAGNELYIISGGYGTKGTIAAGRVNIPATTWKVIVVLPIGDNDASRVTNSTRVIGIWMPNDQGIRSNPWEQYRVSVDYIEAMTGYDFLSLVPAPIQDVVEAQVDGSPMATLTPTVTGTPPTATATRTPTPIAPTATSTATRTPTPIAPTATSTATRTPTPITPTATSGAPTATATPTESPPSTPTATSGAPTPTNGAPTATATSTLGSPTATPTGSPEPTATATTVPESGPPSIFIPLLVR